MRPALLDPLFSPVASLAGVGPNLAKLLAKLLGRENADECRVIDLLFHAPSNIIDRRNCSSGIALAQPGTIVTIQGRVARHQPPPPGNLSRPYRVFLHDETSELALTFFRAKGKYLSKALPIDEEVLVVGKVDWLNERASMIHPNFMVKLSEADNLPLVDAIYPMTAGLSPKALKRAIDSALGKIPVFSEWIDEILATSQSFPDVATSFRDLHDPRDATDIDQQAPARRRLAYDEFLAGQLSLALGRQRLRKGVLAKRPIRAKRDFVARILADLPFSMTQSQSTAVEDILKDMAGEDRMLRLLQGDVGAGKTLVALMAMAAAVEDGGQAVLMAPTEILARQHFAMISKYAAAASIACEVLTGRTKGKEKRKIEERVASGQAQIIIGTHALFQDGVSYKNLALAVVDEQHRFGVHQRLRLTAKGITPHMLVMTATPIPRTLVLAAFGDMDVSKLTEKPAGRKPIQTVSIPAERIGDIIDRLRKVINEDNKAYWICPLVEESEESELMSAEKRHTVLSQMLGWNIGLIHGRMSGPEKDAAILAFKNGETRMLVATTVVEVGVDVPDATIIVIEHAERFGITQLHQLRGRVGRGDKASTCILLYKGPLSENGRARLSILRNSEDGFLIAEEDLKLRGEGELLGTRQSGTPVFRIASLEAHTDLLEIARKDAAYVIERDPDLTTPRGDRLRTLLYLHRRDEAIRFLHAG